MPRFAAADVTSGLFFGVWRVGSKHGWKLLEKGFKMVSRWPYGVKNSLPGVLGTRGWQNGLNSSLYGHGCSGSFHGQGRVYFRNIFIQN
jgi:hypothetical protein